MSTVAVIHSPVTGDLVGEVTDTHKATSTRPSPPPALQSPSSGTCLFGNVRTCYSGLPMR